MTDKVKAAVKASKKLDEKSKSEVFELFGQLEGELQAKDIAIATLKSECLKHLLQNLRSDKNLLCDPVLALNRDSSKKQVKTESNDQTAHKLVALCNLVESQKSTLQRLTSCLSEADKQRTSLLKDLDEERRKNHELTKLTKEQESLILKHSEEKQEPETEDPQKQSDVSDSEELKKLQVQLSADRKNTKEMILVLMEDRRKIATLYMEEKKRSEELNRQLREEKSRIRALGMGLEEESKRSLAMEAELERHLVQINSQAEDLQKSRINSKELEDALRKARADAEHFKKQLSEAHRVAMSQASAAQGPLYAAHNELSVSGSSTASSISPISTSVGGLTASSLVTAAIGGGKQSLGVNYDAYSQATATQPVPKSRSSISSTATMVSRSGHRVVPNVTSVSDSNGGVSSTINRITNSFQVNGGQQKKAPPVPPNKPSVSIYKPLSKLEGMVNSDAIAK